MQNIEENALKTYQNNMIFLEKNHTTIFNKLQNLNTNNYHLEYLDNYFDVKQLSTGSYLYANDSKKISQDLNSLVNYKKNSYLFEGFPLYYEIEKNLDKLDDKTQGLAGVYPIMSYYIDNTDKSDEMQKIEKFIFIGVGLGVHLLEIDAKISANEYLIIEDDLELFHLSLFCTPYYEFNKNATLTFSISENENDFMDNINIFLENSFYLNRYLKYSYFSAHSDIKIKLIQNALTSQDFISFPYKTLLTKYLKPFEYINNSHNITNFSNRFTDSSFSSKPLLILGAGPSLEKNIEWLQKNHHYFVIMAVSSTLKTLHHINIKPDIVTHMDGFESVLKIFEGFDAKTFLKDSITIFGSFIPSKVREKFNKENSYFTEEDTYYFEDYNSLVGPCIGSTSILYSLMLDTKNIYLLGTDFAVDSKTGKTHSETHITKDTHNISDKDKLHKTISFRNNLFPINGNFVPKVYTNSLYQVSIQSLHNRIPLLKKEYQNIYNLNDGAYINQTISQNIHSIDMQKYTKIDKNILHNEIKVSLDKNSSQKLSSDDIKSLKQRLFNTQKIKKYITNYKKDISFPINQEKYLFNLLGLISKILHLNGRESNNIVKVYYMFFKYTLALIMDLLNTKNLLQESSHIEKLDNLLISEIIHIENIYEKSLKEFLKREK